jgi:hypothetical protein
MPRRSLSNEPNSVPKPPHPWLLKHYQEKRERTITLVKAAVDQLVNEQQTVTIEAICHKSLALDPEGRGIKKSAILENAEAHAYYQKHSSSYQTMKQRNRKQRRKPLSPDPQPLRIDPNRDVDRVRYRYLQLTKAEIVERLLTVEQAYAEVQQHLAQLQFHLLELEHQRVEEQRQTRRQSKRKGGKTQTDDSTEQP